METEPAVMCTVSTSENPTPSSWQIFGYRFIVAGFLKQLRALINRTLSFRDFAVRSLIREQKKRKVKIHCLCLFVGGQERVYFRFRKLKKKDKKSYKNKPKAKKNKTKQEKERQKIVLTRVQLFTDFGLNSLIVWQYCRL